MRQYKESITLNGQYLRDYSTIGYAPKTESDVLPASGPYVMELDERIAPGSTITAEIAAVEAEIIPWNFTPVTGQLAVNRALGKFKYASDDGTKAIDFHYTPSGTIVTPAKMEVLGDSPVASVNGHTGEVELDAECT